MKEQFKKNKKSNNEQRIFFNSRENFLRLNFNISQHNFLSLLYIYIYIYIFVLHTRRKEVLVSTMITEEGEDISLEDVDNKEEKEEGAPNATELQKSTVVHRLGDDEDDDDSKKEEEKLEEEQNEQQQQQQQQQGFSNDDDDDDFG